MRGTRQVRLRYRGRRIAAAAVVAFLALLAIPAAALAHISSEVVKGHLIARSDGAADIVKISCGTDLLVKVDGLNPTTGPATCSSIRRVRVFGNGGPDTINVSRVGPLNGFGNPGLRHGFAVRAYGGPSSDRISGSRLADLLAGGDGHDVLRGRAGADVLRGGKGSDRLLGGLGPDRLIGGQGRDRLVGGQGNDVLIDL